MTTPNTIITQLRENFGCRLTNEQFLSILNTLEKRLAFDIVCDTQTTQVIVSEGDTEINLDFPAKNVVRVFVNGAKINRQTVNTPEGYQITENRIVFSTPLPNATVRIDSIAMPKEFTTSDYDKRELFLGEGYDELYIYYVLSREALMTADIDMLNNYSKLYAEALSLLKTEIFKRQSGNKKYRNVW